MHCICLENTLLRQTATVKSQYMLPTQVDNNINWLINNILYLFSVRKHVIRGSSVGLLLMMNRNVRYQVTSSLTYLRTYHRMSPECRYYITINLIQDVVAKFDTMTAVYKLLHLCMYNFCFYHYFILFIFHKCQTLL